MHPAIGPNPHLPPITLDPPRQQQLRRLINPFFAPKVINGLEDQVRAHANRLVDGFAADGHCDLSADFGEPLIPLVFFTDIVHLPEELLAGFMARTVGSATPDEHSQALSEVVADFVELRRRRPPVGDVVDTILQARIDGVPLTDEDVIGCVLILLIGGTDTTRNVVTSSLWYLAEHPDLRRGLIEDPVLIPAAVEEFLRLFGSVQLVGRTVTCPARFEGVDMEPGDKVVLSMAAANRDPAEFPDPTKFELDREVNRHIAFGVGVHRCLGSHLARLEIRVAIETILRRIPGYRLAPGYEFRRRRGHVHGPETLDVLFEPVV
jgi:hypothetical protein